MEEVDRVTYAVLDRFIDSDIAKDYADAAFPEQVARENADMTLRSCDDGFFPSLFDKACTQTQNQSIIYNYFKFVRPGPKRSGKRIDLIYKEIQKFNLDYRIFGHTRAIAHFTFDSTGEFLITGSEDSQLKVWHLPSLSIVFTMQGHEQGLISFDVSPDRRIIASISKDQSIRLWQFENGAAVAMIYLQETDALTTIKFSPCGRYLICGSCTGFVRIYQIMELIPTLDRIKKQIHDGVSHFTIPDTINYFNIYNPAVFLQTPPAPIRQPQFREYVYCISFSPGGNLAAFGLESGNVIITAIETSRTWRIYAHTNACDGIYFYRNNFHQIITWTNKGGEVNVWNLQAKAKKIASFSVRFQQSRSHLIDVQVSCDESIIYGVTAQMVFAWTLDSTTPLLHVEGLQQVVSVSAHPIIPHVFAVAMKGKIWIFDALINQKPMIRSLDIPFETPKLNRALWTPDGLSIIAIDAGGGYYRFKACDVAACRQIPIFFPGDFGASEWVPGVGQIEEETKRHTHLSPRNTIIDSDKVIRCENYIPVKILNQRTIFPPEVMSAWITEERWLTDASDVHDEQEILAPMQKAPAPKPTYESDGDEGPLPGTGYGPKKKRRDNDGDFIDN